MIVISRFDALNGEPSRDSTRFTGEVKGRMLRESGDTGMVRVNVVRFDPGVRVAWHSHTGGQVLHVVEGECLFQSKGGEVVQLHAGDSVCAEPGEVHWHGASDSVHMAHLAVTFGETMYPSMSD